MRATMRTIGEKPMRAIANGAGNACAAGPFVIHAFDNCCCFDVIASDQKPFKSHFADSESQILATK
jgi:hypothetical protein